ncbi:MAG: bacteriohopanetetrol glucosamine biosynthesis glycosyltransferase HpnI [Chloroflexia bacterium]
MFFVLLTTLSALYWIVAWLSVRAFFRERRSYPGDFTPPVSILKPIRGVDPGLYENLASFCRQDYPEYEILCGVLDADDPAIAVVQQLQRTFPERNIRLLKACPLGANRKASILHALAAEARYPILVASDSDMRATPDYLRRVVAPLADPEVGVVTSLCRGSQPESVGAVMEALELGACFAPPALMGLHLLRMAYGFGASIVLRREDLERVGGFAAVADYLADDFQIAARVAQLGRRVVLSDYLIDNVLGRMPLREVYERHVRWLRCARVSRPREYIPMAITLTLPLALLALLFTGFGPLGWLVFLGSLLIREGTTWLIAGHTGDTVVRRHLLWLPLSDLLHACYWAMALLGRRVTWRGDVYLVQRDGRMVPLVPDIGHFPANPHAS